MIYCEVCQTTFNEQGTSVHFCQTPIELRSPHDDSDTKLDRIIELLERIVESTDTLV